MRDAYIGIDELEKMVKNRNRTFFNSKFNFLLDHNGIRPEQIHCIIAPTGASKSTITKSIALELAESTKVLLLINEEQPDEYVLDMNRSLDMKGLKGDEREKILKNISILHERIDEIPSQEDEFFNFMMKKIMQTQAEVFIYDNLTSGFIVNRPVNKQQEISAKLITLTQNMKIASIVVIHAKKDMKPNMFVRTEDVKGLSIFPINASFVYTLSKFEADNYMKIVLWNTKSRMHQSGGKFELIYDSNSRLYTGDRRLESSDIEQIFERINPLKRRIK